MDAIGTFQPIQNRPKKKPFNKHTPVRGSLFDGLRCDSAFSVTEERGTEGRRIDTTGGGFKVFF